MIPISRYTRIYNQLELLTSKSITITSQIATINAVLYQKLDYIFWIGVYFLKENQLVVGPYQGPLACQVLIGPNGVCWAAVNQQKIITVPDVHKFPGHVACDSRSQSELVIPLKRNQQVIAVIDIDSDKPNAFLPTYVKELEKIMTLIDTALPIL